MRYMQHIRICQRCGDEYLYYPVGAPEELETDYPIGGDPEYCPDCSYSHTIPKDARQVVHFGRGEEGQGYGAPDEAPVEDEECQQPLKSAKETVDE